MRDEAMDPVEERSGAIDWGAIRNKVVGFLRYQLAGRDPAEIEDLASEVILELLKEDRETGLKKPESYALIKAGSRLIDRYRREGRWKKIVQPMTAATMEVVGLASLGDPIERFRFVVKELLFGDDVCAPLITAFLDGFSGPEIARKLGITHDNVRTRKTRCLRKLRELLESSSDWWLLREQVI